jgi:hypothetical protein
MEASVQAEMQFLGRSRVEMDALLPQKTSGAGSAVDTTRLSQLLVALGTLVQQRGNAQAKLVAEAAAVDIVAALQVRGREGER